MIKETELRNRLSKKIKQIPSDKLELLENFILKLENPTLHKEDILSFSGSWNDLDKDIANDFTERLIARRENSKRRIDG
ncbi:hypothetical protein MMU07_18000 [Aquiflexum sp. LQ15W]|uniref:hypothetical protein n=1 Tax=Cognataquiflexum nitidum TaxID=2922272 RepID=UPI001F131EF7|nr:hypothetical protein [Cognataquiflexum nitidum]MCH6201479.1 hypothetical protein [Cognataquiflexum nitidum]